MAGYEEAEVNPRDELTLVAKAWEQAMISNKVETIARFIADEWVIVSDSGVTTRESFLAFVSSGDLTHDVFQGAIVSIRQYGEVAVLVARVKNSGRYRGEPFSADEWTTDVFVKRDATWRCVHSQITTARAA